MDLDPFDTLGLPARFDLRPGEINAAYLARAGAVHPDAGPLGAGPADEEHALAASAALNHARQVLEDPRRRAEALLRRHGGATPSQDRSLPPGFLSDILTIREQLEEDMAVGRPGAAGRWDEWARQREAAHEARVAALFSGLAAAPDAAALAALRQELNTWNYTERLLEQVRSTG